MWSSNVPHSPQLATSVVKSSRRTWRQPGRSPVGTAWPEGDAFAAAPSAGSGSSAGGAVAVAAGALVDRPDVESPSFAAISSVTPTTTATAAAASSGSALLSDTLGALPPDSTASWAPWPH